MSESKHTPGPWYKVNDLIYRRPKHELYEHGGGVGGDKPIATAFKGWAGEGYPVEANTHLIAAAPELLEALEAIHRIINLPPGLEKQATEAIQKAKGVSDV